MDLILGSFAKDFVPNASDEEIKAYDELLNESDPDLYNWISGREKAPADKNNLVLKKLLGYQVRK